LQNYKAKIEGRRLLVTGYGSSYSVVILVFFNQEPVTNNQNVTFPIVPSSNEINQTMRKGTIRFVVLALIAITGLLMLRSSSVKQPACKGSLEECCQKKREAPAENKLIWDTFSRQFISFIF